MFTSGFSQIVWLFSTLYNGMLIRVPTGTSRPSKTRGLVVSLCINITGGFTLIASLRHIVKYGNFGKSVLVEKWKT